MFLYWMAPASINSRNVEDFGYRLEISQKFPWPGKRSLRGQNALAEASAARHEIEDTRLQLIESARMAFYDYFLVARALEVNQEALRLLKEFRQNAENRYTKGLLNQQDILQAEVEIGRQQERGLALDRMRRVAMARLNTLMHLPPQAHLPPPLAKLSPPEPVTDLAGFQARALAARPDLLALNDRLAAERTALALAHKEFYPDVEAMAAYDTIMGNGPMRDLAPQVGLRLNLPIRRAKRYGAVAEAEARLAQRQAELARQVDQVHYDVEQAFAQATESDRTLRLYEEKILPAAVLNIKAAQAAYIPGRIPFLSLVEAQRNLVMLRDRYYEALADAFRRRATLERVSGGPPTPAGQP
jgi:outer membrane protein TolC